MSTEEVKHREPWERFDDDIHLARRVRKLCEERWQHHQVANPHAPTAWVVKSNGDHYCFIDLWSPSSEDDYDDLDDEFGPSHETY